MSTPKGSNRGRRSKGTAYQYRTGFVNEEGFPTRLAVQKVKLTYAPGADGRLRMTEEKVSPKASTHLCPTNRNIIELYLLAEGGHLFPSPATPEQAASNEAAQREWRRIVHDWLRRLHWGEDPRVVFKTPALSDEFPTEPASVRPTAREQRIWSLYQQALSSGKGRRKVTPKAARQHVADALSAERPGRASLHPDGAILDAIKKVKAFLKSGGLLRPEKRGR